VREVTGGRPIFRRQIPYTGLRESKGWRIGARPPMKASRAPHLPLSDLEAILGGISELLGGFHGVAGVAELDGRIGQCHSAIDACRRYKFSPVLLRALSAKVLDVETDALVLRRTLRMHDPAPDRGRGHQARGKRRRRRR
jgi:hypothetical protein